MARGGDRGRRMKGPTQPGKRSRQRLRPQRPASRRPRCRRTILVMHRGVRKNDNNPFRLLSSIPSVRPDSRVTRAILVLPAVISRWCGTGPVSSAIPAVPLPGVPEVARNLSLEAVILKATEAGEGNRTVVLYSDEAGILYATAYGGMKGRLRGLAVPFNYGIAFLYRDPVKNYCKLTDFDVRSFFYTFRENLLKFYTVSLWAEFILRSRAGGTGSAENAFARQEGAVRVKSDGLFRLFADSLGLLDGETEDSSPYISIQFLLRSSRIMGFMPPLDVCAECGGGIPESVIHLYSRNEEGFVCADCAARFGLVAEGSAGRYAQLNAGSTAYVRGTVNLDLKAAIRVRVGKESLASLKRFAIGMAEGIIGEPLRSVETGYDIL